MSILTLATWLVCAACIAIVAMGIYAISIDRPEHHGDSVGVCIPTRQNTLTGAFQEPQTAIHDDSQAEIERLRAVIRQRNRMINKLRAELEQQPVEQPVMSRQPATLDRFANLELRGEK